MGVKGQLDITMIVKRTRDGLGVTGFIEVKTGGARTSESQKKFIAMLERIGVPYCLARSVQDALEFRERVASS